MFLVTKNRKTVLSRTSASHHVPACTKANRVLFINASVPSTPASAHRPPPAGDSWNPSTAVRKKHPEPHLAQQLRVHYFSLNCSTTQEKQPGCQPWVLMSRWQSRAKARQKILERESLHSVQPPRPL